MASSSTHVKKYHVFPSFHGPDVRRKFLSHLHYHFANKGITAFKDQGIVRGLSIGPELKQAIGESRISIVVLSEKYASSRWCLDELVEILKCKEASGQIVMTVFYDVDPSDVRNKSGNFGKAFEETCVHKTKEVKERWANALTDVANIAGQHSVSWNDEAKMTEKIVADVSEKLNVTASRDFEEMVGLEAHLKKLDSLLCHKSDEVKMIGIWGPAGIGKTTIARALYNQLSTKFQFKCFMGNLKGRCKSIGDNYDWKLNLQNQLLSKILNQDYVKTDHLGAIKDWLEDKKVLIVIDDVDDLEQLLALAKEPSWFGSGSRIIVTTKDKTNMKALVVNDNNFYHVCYPSNKVALEILCLSAFQKSSPRDGFEELAKKVAHLCGNLPLCLSVVGSSLRGENKHGWKLRSHRLETSLDRKIEDVLKLGYENLSRKEKFLFLHIACFFNYAYTGAVTTMLADSNLDVKNGLNTLVSNCLVHISKAGQIVMHHLLQQLGIYTVLEQSSEPGKRQFLVAAEEIRDVLANETGTGSVLGISFDMSKVSEFSISGRAFEGMRNLQFLKIYRRTLSKEVTLRLVEEINYLPRLRLLHWDSFPRKRLPTFRSECLIEVHLPNSKLEKLWGGIKPLTNLRKLNLSFSRKLKEIPNLSDAANLRILLLSYCTSLVELPSSISNLHELRTLMMVGCKMLKVVPTNINLASLEELSLNLCSQLRSFPDISRNIKKLDVGKTKIEEVPPSVVRQWSCLEYFGLECRSLKRLTYIPPSIIHLCLSFSDIETIPDCVIGLRQLQILSIKCCRKLVSLPALSPSLKFLCANHCRSLERVRAFHNPVTELIFHNCLKLDGKARRVIIQQRVERYIWLPGKNVPAEFTHKATGNNITIPLAPVDEGTFSMSSRFKACLLFSPIDDYPVHDITCRLRIKGGAQINKFYHRVVIQELTKIRAEHLFIFYGDLFQEKLCVDAASKIQFEFSYKDNHKIIKCGVQIFMEKAESSSSSSEEDYFDAESSSSEEDYFDAESSSSEEDYFDAEGTRSKAGHFKTIGNRKHNKSKKSWS